MNDEHSDGPERAEVAGDSSGGSVPVRSEGGVDGAADPGDDASSQDGRQSERDPLEGIDPDELRDNPVLLSQITAYLQENHLHLPILAPDRREMALMRAETPELYHLYVDGLRKSVEADFIQRTYPYTEPLKNVMVGRRYGLVVVLAVLVLAGVALVLDHPWFAGVITALDVVGLAAVFGSGGNAGHRDGD